MGVVAFGTTGDLGHRTGSGPPQAAAREAPLPEARCSRNQQSCSRRPVAPTPENISRGPIAGRKALNQRFDMPTPRAAQALAARAALKHREPFQIGFGPAVVMDWGSDLRAAESSDMPCPWAGPNHGGSRCAPAVRTAAPHVLVDTGATTDPESPALTPWPSQKATLWTHQQDTLATQALCYHHDSLQPPAKTLMPYFQAAASVMAERNRWSFSDDEANDKGDPLVDRQSSWLEESNDPKPARQPQTKAPGKPKPAAPMRVPIRKPLQPTPRATIGDPQKQSPLTALSTQSPRQPSPRAISPRGSRPDKKPSTQGPTHVLPEHYRLPGPEQYSIQGRLFRLSGRWRKRWSEAFFLVQNNVFLSCAREEPILVDLCIPLKNVQAIEWAGSGKPQYGSPVETQFDIKFLESDKKGREQVSTLRCRASTVQEAQTWVKTLRELWYNAKASRVVLGDFVDRDKAQESIQELHSLVKNNAVQQLANRAAALITAQQLRDLAAGLKQLRDSAMKLAVEEKTRQAHEAAHNAEATATSSIALAQRNARLRVMAFRLAITLRGRCIQALLQWKENTTDMRLDQKHRAMHNAFVDAIIHEQASLSQKKIHLRKIQMAAALARPFQRLQRRVLHAWLHQVHLAAVQEELQKTTLLSLIQLGASRRREALTACVLRLREHSLAQKKRDSLIRELFEQRRKSDLAGAVRVWTASLITGRERSAQITQMLMSFIRRSQLAALSTGLARLRHYTSCCQQQETLQSAATVNEAHGHMLHMMATLPKERACYRFAYILDVIQRRRCLLFFYQLKRIQDIQTIRHYRRVLGSNGVATAVQHVFQRFLNVMKHSTRESTVEHLMGVMHIASTLQRCVERQRRKVLSRLGEEKALTSLVSTSKTPQLPSRESPLNSVAMAVDSLVRNSRRRHISTSFLLWKAHCHEKEFLQGLIRLQYILKLSEVIEKRQGILIIFALARWAATVSGKSNTLETAVKALNRQEKQASLSRPAQDKSPCGLAPSPTGAWNDMIWLGEGIHGLDENGTVQVLLRGHRKAKPSEPADITVHYVSSTAPVVARSPRNRVSSLSRRRPPSAVPDHTSATPTSSYSVSPSIRIRQGSPIHSQISRVMTEQRTKQKTATKITISSGSHPPQAVSPEYTPKHWLSDTTAQTPSPISVVSTGTINLSSPQRTPYLTHFAHSAIPDASPYSTSDTSPFRPSVRYSVGTLHSEATAPLPTRTSSRHTSTFVPPSQLPSPLRQPKDKDLQTRAARWNDDAPLSRPAFPYSLTERTGSGTSLTTNEPPFHLDSAPKDPDFKVQPRRSSSTLSAFGTPPILGTYHNGDHLTSSSPQSSLGISASESPTRPPPIGNAPASPGGNAQQPTVSMPSHLPDPLPPPTRRNYGRPSTAFSTESSLKNTTSPCWFPFSACRPVSPTRSASVRRVSPNEQRVVDSPPRRATERRQSSPSQWRGLLGRRQDPPPSTGHTQPRATNHRKTLEEKKSIATHGFEGRHPSTILSPVHTSPSSGLRSEPLFPPMHRESLAEQERRMILPHQHVAAQLCPGSSHQPGFAVAHPGISCVSAGELLMETHHASDRPSLIQQCTTPSNHSITVTPNLVANIQHPVVLSPAHKAPHQSYPVCLSAHTAPLEASVTAPAHPCHRERSLKLFRPSAVFFRQHIW